MMHGSACLSDASEDAYGTPGSISTPLAPPPAPRGARLEPWKVLRDAAPDSSESTCSEDVLHTSIAWVREVARRV
ncbi:hypothetical protein ACKKBG_A28275 [Auxenochlorella protothecoides x Auxenochlorella symbiontica]